MKRLVGIWRHVRGATPFAANAALTAATNVIIGVLGIASGTLAARLLGPHVRGELAAIQTWPMLIGYLSLLGTSDALVYYSALEPEQAASYLGSAGAIALLCSGPFMLIAYLVMPVLLAAQSATVVTAARWYLLVVPVVALVGLPYYPLRGRDDFVAWNALRITPAVPWIAILAVAWFFSYRNPEGLALAYLIGLALLFFPIAYVAKRRIPGSMIPDSQKFRPLLGYGLPCMMTTLPQTLNLRLDQMLMAGLLPPAQLGFYVVAVAWSGMINPLANAIGAALFPRIAMEAQQEERALAFARGSRLGALTAIAVGALLMISTPWGMVLLFGKGFRPAVTAGLILVSAGAVSGLNTVLEEGLRGLGHPTSVMQAEFAGLVITVIALALMLRSLGIIGASVASLLGYSTVAAVLLAYARWHTGTSFSDLLIPSSREIRLSVAQVQLLVRKAGTMPGQA